MVCAGILVNDVENDRCDDEDHANDRGQTSKNAVRSGSLALAEEGVCAALDGAKTLLRALLKQNDNDQEQACDDHDDRKSDLCGSHVFFPPLHFSFIFKKLFFNLSKAEFLCFLFTIILILFAEMTNTAIETVVDLCTEVYHPKAKIAKDVAAGGVVVTTINAVIVAYFLFFDKLSEMGIAFLQNIATSPQHLAFSVIIIVIIAALALIAFSKTNKHKIFNDKFIPSGHATIAFAANTIIWISTQNPVILILSLVMAILIAESRIQAKEHRLSEVIFSACLGTILVLVLYGIARLFIA